MSTGGRAGWSRAGLAAAGAAMLALGWAQGPQASPGNELTVERIAEDLHVLVGSGGNVSVYTTRAGLILVDDKFERNVAEILEKVKSISPLPVKYVLNTHHHGDHSGGNAMLKEKTGATLVSHVNARDNMVERKMPGVPEETFSGTRTIRLGGKEVRAYYFGRGHTNGDAVYLFPARRVVHMGDLFAYGGPFIDYSAKGSGVEITGTLEKALKLKADTVIPGHGPISKMTDLAAYRGEVAGTVAEVRQLKAAGRGKDELKGAVKTGGLKYCCTGPLFERSLPGLWDEAPR